MRGRRDTSSHRATVEPQDVARHRNRNGMSPVAGAELLQYVPHVHPDRLTGNGKTCCDLLVTSAPSDEEENLGFTTRERPAGAATGRLARNRARYHRPSCPDLAD